MEEYGKCNFQWNVKDSFVSVKLQTHVMDVGEGMIVSLLLCVVAVNQAPPTLAAVLGHLQLLAYLTPPLTNFLITY